MTEDKIYRGIHPRYSQHSYLEDDNKRRSNSTGLYQNYKCPICGLNKGKNFNHDKCSKILQQRGFDKS
jgi:hypothetical protein